jgi:hypothetical protein
MQLGRFSDRLFDDRIEFDDTPGKLLPRTGCVCEISGPATAKAAANRPMISVAMDAIRAANRRSALLKSVPARMMPAHTMPMQISVQRVMAIKKAHAAAHITRPARKAMRFCGKQAASTTMAIPPTIVPITRYQPLRNEAPRWG